MSSIINSFSTLSYTGYLQPDRQSPKDGNVEERKSPTQNDAAVVELSTPSSESPESTGKATAQGNADIKKQLTEEEQRIVEELKRRDREVKTHEQAHLAALGAYRSGGVRYSFKTGPDGKRYATDGEVSVTVSKEQTPEETILKAQTIRRAALAPAQPSGADRSVAAQASQLEAEARQELAQEKQGQFSTTSTESEQSSEPVLSTSTQQKTKHYKSPQTCESCGATFNSTDRHSHYSIAS